MTESSQPHVAGDFPREVLDLFDEYVHGAIDRRGFLERATTYTGSAAAAAATLAMLRPDFARAQVVAPADARIAVTRVPVPSPQGTGTINCYVAKPVAAKGKKLPVIVVAHENRGLNPHIEDIARRLAVDGFLAVAPDALTPLGGYPGDEDKAREAFGKLDGVKTRADYLAAANWALALPDGNGRLGAVGFCWGGGMVNYLATKLPRLRAGVPFYGSPPPLEDVPAIKAELVLNFAGNDARVTGSFPPYEEALKKAGVTYHAYVYPGVEHGFNNDTTPRYDKAAATLAWTRTMELFRRTLA